MTTKKRWVRQLPKNTVEVDNLDKIVGVSHGNKRRFLVVVIGSTKRVADLIKNKLGLDIKNYDHTIDNYAVQHSYAKHKNDPIPLKKSDFRKIRSVIKTADRIYWNGDQNKNAVVYEKNYLRKYRLVYVEKIYKTRRELAMKTMYWQPRVKSRHKKIAPRSPRTLI